MGKTGKKGVHVGLAILAGTILLRSSAGAQEPRGPHLDLPQVLERGDAGPTLLLIPCAGCGAPSWNRFMEVNSERFNMLAVTLPGYDGSPRPDLPLWSDSTVFQDNALRRLSDLIDERSLSDVVVVGQSFGSLIALRLATLRPDAVRAVVNVDGSPTNSVERADESLAERVEEARRVVDEDWAVRLQDPDTYRRFNAATRQPDAEERKLHHGMFMASDRVSMLHYWRENFLRDRNPEFRELAVPYLDVNAVYPWDPNPDSTAAAHVASMDAVGTPEGYQRVTFWDTSHWVHLERPRKLGTVILDFLEKRGLHDVGPFRFGELLTVGEGPRDLVLIPCPGCDASSWSGFMERNRARYHMVAVTWPNLGSAARPGLAADTVGTPHLDYLMDALDLLIERRKLERPVLVGHSAAAVVAMRFAAEQPDRVSAVVNVDEIVANDGTAEGGPGQRLAWEDAGRYLPSLTVPFLAIHALPEDTERAARKRAELSRRYARAPMPVGGRVAFMDESGPTIWEDRPEAFDAVIADFILGAKAETVR